MAASKATTTNISVEDVIGNPKAGEKATVSDLKPKAEPIKQAVKTGLPAGPLRQSFSEASESLPTAGRQESKSLIYPAKPGFRIPPSLKFRKGKAEL